MRHAIELPTNGCIDVRMVVAMDIGPDRRIAIDVFAATAIPQNCSMSLDQKERLMPWGAPFPHVGEWMPNKALVGLNQLFRIPFSHSCFNSVCVSLTIFTCVSSGLALPVIHRRFAR